MRKTIVTTALTAALFRAFKHLVEAISAVDIRENQLTRAAGSTPWAAQNRRGAK
ncbi:MAG: hypothetical protein Q8R82_04190 [Hyphomonadaceae bacterium]|nr:hypothetical protein [Hyphomonadaceae bacterium]